jgi:hypothetical protein
MCYYGFLLDMHRGGVELVVHPTSPGVHWVTAIGLLIGICFNTNLSTLQVVAQEYLPDRLLGLTIYNECAKENLGVFVSFSSTQDEHLVDRSLLSH